MVFPGDGKDVKKICRRNTKQDRKIEKIKVREQFFIAQKIQCIDHQEGCHAQKQQTQVLF
jgi:hypothetical protein